MGGWLAHSLILSVMGFQSLPTLKPQFFLGMDSDQFHIMVELLPGTGIAERIRVFHESDALLIAEEDIFQMTCVFGPSAPPSRIT